jgi:hypothetical protein
MSASAVVANAAAAVEAADKVPESAEVAAAPAAAASKKYDDATKRAAKHAEAIRGQARSAGPVQVLRVRSALKGTKHTAEDVVKAFKSVKAATEFAGGSKDVEKPELVSEISSELADPWCKGRGLVAICLALREQAK